MMMEEASLAISVPFCPWLCPRWLLQGKTVIDTITSHRNDAVSVQDLMIRSFISGDILAKMLFFRTDFSKYHHRLPKVLI
ncbi:MAG: hypothetical protein IPN79_06065 [Saprospiraceae bacterium]|nr:hypothetical protein [Saprospiraceae bacterium]